MQVMHKQFDKNIGFSFASRGRRIEEFVFSCDYDEVKTVIVSDVKVVDTQKLLFRLTCLIDKVF